MIIMHVDETGYSAMDNLLKKVENLNKLSRCYHFLEINLYFRRAH